jgi:two-component sensor histidine kinase
VEPPENPTDAAPGYSGGDAPSAATSRGNPWELTVDLATVVLMTVVYFLTARFSQVLLANPNGVAVFWPASGVAVGTLLALERRHFWPIGAGIAIATIAANVVAGRPFIVTPIFAAANVIECYCVGWLTERYLGPHLKFDSLRRVLGVFLAAAAGTAISGVVGAITFGTLGSGGDSIAGYWQEWFFSDLIGIIALVPFFLGLKGLVTRESSIRDHAEGVVLIVLVSATSLLIFPDLLPSAFARLAIPEVLLFPPLLLLAIRQPLTYAPIGASTVALIIVASTVAKVDAITEGEAIRAQAAIVSLVACSLSLAALIAELRSAESRQRLLIAELNHRVKNGLALVQAVVDRSRESAFSIDDFYAALAGRINSMARTHSLLSREKWQGLSLAELIETELLPYQKPGRDTVSGPSVLLGPVVAQSLSLVLHELSTNAAKYGALSCPGGQVSVTWSIESSEQNKRDLVIEWRESGAPARNELGPQNYGTNIIRNLLTYEANAVISLVFPTDGARCSIRLPLAGADISVT